MKLGQPRMSKPQQTIRLTRDKMGIIGTTACCVVNALRSLLALCTAGKRLLQYAVMYRLVPRLVSIGTESEGINTPDLLP